MLFNNTRNTGTAKNQRNWNPDIFVTMGLLIQMLHHKSCRHDADQVWMLINSGKLRAQFNADSLVAISDYRNIFGKPQSGFGGGRICSGGDIVVGTNKRFRMMTGRK